MEKPLHKNANGNYITLGTERYKINFIIEMANLLIRLEPEDNNLDNIYQTSLTLKEIKQLHKTFKGSDDLEEAKETFLDILNSGNLNRAEKNDNNVSLIINIFGKDVSIPLKKLEKEGNIIYKNLSDEIQAIIEDKQLIIGIDLGTTFSSASVMLDNDIIMIKNSLGLNITPSYVCFLEEDKIIVGELAQLQPSYEYTNTIYNVKRLMGRK